MPARSAMRRLALPPASRLPSCARSTITDCKTRCIGRCASQDLPVAYLPRRTLFSRRTATESPCAMCLGFCSETLCPDRTTPTRSSCKEISVRPFKNLCFKLAISPLTCLRFKAPNDDGSGAYAQGKEDEEYAKLCKTVYKFDYAEAIHSERDINDPDAGLPSPRAASDVSDADIELVCLLLRFRR